MNLYSFAILIAIDKWFRFHFLACLQNCAFFRMDDINLIFSANFALDIVCDVNNLYAAVIFKLSRRESACSRFLDAELQNVIVGYTIEFYGYTALQIFFFGSIGEGFYSVSFFIYALIGS